MFTHILAPYDGSINADRALKKAAEMANLTGAKVTLLTIYRHHSMLEASLSMVRVNDPGNIDDAMQAHATEIISHGKQLMKDAGVENVRAFVRSGRPARAVTEFAKKHDADLIVIGSRGLGATGDSYLLGSVSHKVTGLAKCPVLVV
ncbi:MULTISPECIES: universal stress protein [Sulfitobacter]|uniref:TRAP-T-associated universal stress protein TeaD n=1 Tax=Sulfitobacter dubius TaxID=218673 RepID=A0ABY3ZP34_9RHOB|nr:universal stress protein [Sulfitobacter dubius]UOA16381.1 TRAP-T-associated universal stress protein TeaD [Sulfitobacter dubius]WOI28070.1 universal stress protein [Sulfitobacter dubius]